MRHLRQAAQGSPDDVEILYHLGEAYNEGVRQSARLLLHSSRDSALYPWAMGLAAERKSDTSSAIEQYLKALEIDPNLAELYARLVALFERAGLAELAREASQRYALLRPRRAGKIAAGGQEMGGIPEDRYRREWQRLAAVRPQPGLPNVADVFVNKAVQQRLVADQSGAFQAAFREYERGQFAASAETFRALLQSERRDWIAGYLLARAEVAAGDFDAGEQVLEEWLAAQLEVPSVALLRIEIQSELALRCYDWYCPGSRIPSALRCFAPNPMPPRSKPTGRSANTGKCSRLI